MAILLNLVKSSNVAALIGQFPEMIDNQDLRGECACWANNHLFCGTNKMWCKYPLFTNAINFALSTM